MSKSDKTAEAMAEGYNCAQAIATTYGTEFGIPEETFARIASAFGSGMGRSDEICGGVTGALMILGLKFGPKNQFEREARGKTYALAKEFIAEFKRRHGSVSCTDLLGHNLAIPGESKKASEKGLFTSVCGEVVRNAGKLLEEFLARD